MSEYIWIHYSRPRPHWYSLSEKEQQTKQAQWDEVNTASPGKMIGEYHIRGQHDFQTVSVWHFNSAEEAFNHWAALTEVAYNQWFAFSNNIGMSLEKMSDDPTDS